MKTTWLAVLGLAVVVGCSDDVPTLDVVTSALDSDPAWQEDATGLTSIDVEHFHNNVALNGQNWVQENDSLSSGGKRMRALPNVGTTYTTSQLAISPRMEFKINFQFTGDHYIWLRGSGLGGSSDANHAGLDGGQVIAQMG